MNISLADYTEMVIKYEAKLYSKTGGSEDATKLFFWGRLLGTGQYGRASLLDHELLSYGVINPNYSRAAFESNLQAHPITIAIAMEEDYPDIAKTFWERMQMSLEDTNNMGTYYEPRGLMWVPPARTLPKLEKATARCFRSRHAANYAPAGLRNVMRAFAVSANWHAIDQMEVDLKIRQRFALHCLEGTIGASRPPLDLLARIVMRCHPDDVWKRFEAYKGRVAYTALIAMPDLTSEQMVEALRNLGSREEWRGGYSFMQRAPTVDELVKLRGSSLSTVLSRMLWRFLEPIATNAESREKLVAALMRNGEEVDAIRSCFNPAGTLRATVHYTDEAAEERKQEEACRANWYEYKEDLLRRYTLATDIRQRMEAEGLPESARIWLAMDALSGNDEHARARDWLAGKFELEESLRAFDPIYPRKPSGEFGIARLDY